MCRIVDVSLICHYSKGATTIKNPKKDPTVLPRVIMERHSNLAGKELRLVEQDRAKYLELALRNYSKVLGALDNARSGDEDIAVFRFDEKQTEPQ